MSKYDPLGDYLRSRPGRETPVTFAEIEKIIGTPLPPRAQFHPAWWSNNPSNNTMTKVWLDAGFRTERVDISGRRLVFVRTESPRRPPERSTAVPAASEKWPPRTGPDHPAYGALKGLIHVAPGVDLTEPADPEWGELAWGDEFVSDLKRPPEATEEPYPEDRRRSSPGPVEPHLPATAVDDAVYAGRKLQELGNNKSAAIRRLHQEGWRNVRIARALGILDQFVSNVVRAMR